MVAINARSSALAVSLVLATLASVDALPVQQDLSRSPEKPSARAAAPVNSLRKVSSKSRFLRRSIIVSEELDSPLIGHQQASFSIPKREARLLARDHDHDHDHDHNHGHDHEYDHDHDHDHDHHHRRRSIVIPNGHGSHYIVSHQARSAGKREQQGVPGYINIMSDSKKLGSLILDTSNSSHYVLDASEKNQTEMYLVPAGSGSNPEQYFIQIPLIDMQTASVVPWCATYDPSPPQAEPLVVEKCEDAPQAQAHKSQYFAFDKETGVVHPMWYSDKDSTDSGTAAAKEVDGMDAAEGSDLASVTSEGGLLSRDDSSQNMTAQSVTLVFTPSGTQVENVADLTTSESLSSTASASTAPATSQTSVAIAAATATTTHSAVSSSSTTATSSAISRSATSLSADPSSTAAALDVEVVPNKVSSSAVTSATSTSSTVSSSVVSSTVRSLDAEAVASSIAASSASSTATASTSDARLSAAAATTSTAASSSMTPVTSATAPYQWMFKENTRL